MSERVPAWLREEIRQAKRGEGRIRIEETSSLLARLGLSTVCDSARCPNRGECFSHSTATFLILGELCTRNCAFCAVKHGLAAAGCDMVTLGQYLAPSVAHVPVHRYVLRYEFNYWREIGQRMGLKSVVAGPLVRSSYKAAYFFKELA